MNINNPPILVCVMGATNAGKTTLLDAIYKMNPQDVGLVEVGKTLRAKYGPDYFKGQAAPEHTALEAWQLLTNLLYQYEQENKKIVLVDGQPRDYKQCRDMRDLPHFKLFVHLWAPAAIREERARARDGHDPAKLQLSLDRLHGDIPMIFDLWAMVEAWGFNATTYRTDVEGQEIPRRILEGALNMYSTQELYNASPCPSG